MSKIAELFAKNLLRMRKEKRWTQAHVASQTDVSQQTIQRWENGLSWPTSANIDALGELFGVNPSEFFMDGKAQTSGETQELEAKLETLRRKQEETDRIVGEMKEIVKDWPKSNPRHK